jgi:hypothetical protein
MVGGKLSRFAVLMAALFALGVFSSVASAQTCTPGSGTVTCTGGAGSQVIDTNNGNTYPQPTMAAQSGFPTTINVTGGGAVVQTVSITLHGYKSIFNTSGSNAYFGSAEMGLMLVSPNGHNLEVLRSVGNPNVGENDITVMLADGNALAPDANTFSGTWTTGTYSPASYMAEEPEPNYTQAGAPTLQHAAGTGTDSFLNGHSTFNSVNGVFGGDTINGAWKLYLVSDAYFETNVSFSSWDITITYTAASVPTTTSLSLSSYTAFTSSPNNVVTLTATVSGAGSPTGTVLFQTGGTSLSCSAGNPVPLNGNGEAACITSFTTEGYQPLSATYSGNSTFEGSSGTAGIYTYNHATSSGTRYCNSGEISGTGSAVVGPYPSVIYVGDGTSGSPSIPSGSVETVSVTLQNFSAPVDANGLHMMLMSPDGTHSFDFWGEAGGGAASSGSYTLEDGAGSVPNSPLSPGTYGPTANYTTDTFVLGSPIPNPAPQPATTFSLAAPAGSKSFEASFVGASANGAWLLFVDNEGTTQVPGTSMTMGGWCVDISPASGTATTTSLTSNPSEYATKGNQVTFTATVTSNSAVNEGTVTFTENDAPLVGAPNSGVVSVSNGTASISTSSLPEGDHTITATYHDAAATYNDSLGTKAMRVDAATPTPTLNGSTWTYCNPAGITIPAGMVFSNDTGPAAPNPSNIFVTNLPGTVNTVTLNINSFNVEFPADLESLLVGPNRASPPTQTQTLDFFSLTGGTVNTNFNQTMTFSDAYALVPAGGPVGTQVAPTSRGATSYASSAFYTLPGALQYAAPQGAFTLSTSGNGVYVNTNPNGTWSLYFDQTIHETGGGAASWCVNLLENPVTVAVTESHTGTFAQGQQGAQITTAIQNNGPGPTGDPSQGTYPLTLTDSLNPAFTYTGYTGSGWSCNASGQTVTCTNETPVAQEDSYATLTLNVDVSNTASTPISNQANVSGAGVTSTSGSDSIAVNPAAVLSVTKSHPGTFTQGQTAEWDITVNNTASGGNTVGTTNVSDTLPSGYTLNNYSSSGNVWTCSSITNAVTCQSTQTVVGGSSFSTLKLIVNVPAASPASVSNTAFAYGGGDLNHTTLSSAASGTDASVPVVQVPATLSDIRSQTQEKAVGTVYAGLGVTVLDGGGVIIPNYSPVVFTATTGSNGQSGTFPNSTSTISVSADGTGVAHPGTFTANTMVGSYSVGVSAGAASTTYNLINLAGPAAIVTKVTGGGQQAVVNTTFAIDFTVKVTDQYGNPVPNPSVTFTAPSSGASGTFQQSGTNTTTVTGNKNSEALASAYTANGTIGGPYVVSATSGSASVNFMAYNASAITTLSLEPDGGTKAAGGTHTVMVTGTSASSAAVPNAPVHFIILSGPNAGQTAAKLTNASGQAMWTYTGSGGAGTDTIQAYTDGGMIVSNTVTETWEAGP